MSKETIDLKDLDDLLCKYEVKDLEDLENRFKNVPKLEAKLAESEKQRQHLKDWLDNEILTSVDSESYYATINEYEEEVKKLKQRLEESESELVLAKNTSINTNKMEILHLQIENEELKQQLAEKEKEIEYFESEWKSCQQKLDHYIGECLKLKDEQNQKAIEEFKELRKLLNADYRLQETNYTYTEDYYVCLDIINEYIDQQINELKGEE